MAVKLLSPWIDYAPGAVVDLGEAIDEKLIRAGKAVKIIDEKAVRQPKDKKHGSA